MTSSYFNLKPVDTRCILPIELLVAKWSHSITFEPAFLTEWGAVECARQLSFELGTYDGIVRQNVSSLRDLFQLHRIVLVVFDFVMMSKFWLVMTRQFV